MEFNNLSLVKIAVNRGGSVKDREKDVARWVNNAKKEEVNLRIFFDKDEVLKIVEKLETN